jgi:hypothetical protein
VLGILLQVRLLPACECLGVFKRERGSGGWERNVGRRRETTLADMR